MSVKYLARRKDDVLTYRLYPSNKNPRPTARDEMFCAYCGKPIPEGEQYWNGRLFNDAGWNVSIKLHDHGGCFVETLGRITNEEGYARDLFASLAGEKYSREAAIESKSKRATKGALKGGQPKKAATNGASEVSELRAEVAELKSLMLDFLSKAK